MVTDEDRKLADRLVQDWYTPEQRAEMIAALRHQVKSQRETVLTEFVMSLTRLALTSFSKTERGTLIQMLSDLPARLEKATTPEPDPETICGATKVGVGYIGRCRLPPGHPGKVHVDGKLDGFCWVDVSKEEE